VFEISKILFLIDLLQKLKKVFYDDDFEKKMTVVDLTNQLDQSFLTVFDWALQNDQINFALRLEGCASQRLTESLLNMLDNHVQFIKPEERVCSAIDLKNDEGFMHSL